MALLKRRIVNTKSEETILIGLVTSDTFCRDILPLISKETIETPYIAKVVRWCKEYYDEYKQAPGGHITDMYEIEKESLDKADQDAISAILTKLSEEYSTADINEEYMKDQALKLIETRAMKYAASQANTLLDLGKLKEAKEAMKSYKEISLISSGWEDPLNPVVVKNHYVDQQLKKSHLFQFPGALGTFLGPMERNWLVAFMGPAKRGKTFWLIETALQAVFSHKKAIIISLEMNKERIRNRMYARLTVAASETRDYIYPVFDCLKNQNGTCNKSMRKNPISLLDTDGQKPTYNREMKYAICDACRGKQDFFPSTWFTTSKVEKMKSRKAIKMIGAQTQHFGYNEVSGSNLRTLAYPAFSANLARVKGDINNLIEYQDFVPDVIVIDYADILAPEDNRIVGRERIDQTWKSLKGMSDELHCMVLTASQSNRGSFDKKNVVQTDAAEDIRKIANSDLFLAINQTPAEKKASITRIAKIAMRDGEFDQYASCIVLQQLSLGQVLLDSYLDRSTTVIENPYDNYFE